MRDIRVEIEVVALISNLILSCHGVLVRRVTAAWYFTDILPSWSNLSHLAWDFSWLWRSTLLTFFSGILDVFICLTSFKAKSLWLFRFNAVEIRVKFRWLEWFLVVGQLSIFICELLLRVMLFVWTLSLIIAHSSNFVGWLLHAYLLSIILCDDWWEKWWSILLYWSHDLLHLLLCQPLIALPWLDVPHGS